MLHRPETQDPARVISPAKPTFRKYIPCLDMKSKLTNLKDLLRYHVPVVDCRTLLHRRQLPIPAKDSYMDIEDREVPPWFLDLLERENDCTEFGLYGLALRTEDLPLDVSHGTFSVHCRLETTTDDSRYFWSSLQSSGLYQVSSFTPYGA